METFPFGPNAQVVEYPLDQESEYGVLVSQFENGSEQTRAIWPRPRRRWRLSWSAATPAEKELAEAFLRDHLGPATQFYLDLSECIPRPYRGPTLGQSLGGTLGARTRYAAFTWADASHETTPSCVISALAVSTGYLLTVTVPIFPKNDTRAFVYVGATSSVLYEQADAITTSAGTWTEPVGGYATGTDTPPTTNTLVETVTVRFDATRFSAQKVSPMQWTFSVPVVEVMN